MNCYGFYLTGLMKGVGFDFLSLEKMIFEFLEGEVERDKVYMRMGYGNEFKMSVMSYWEGCLEVWSRLSSCWCLRLLKMELEV